MKRSLALLFLFLAFCSAGAFASPPPSWSSDARLLALNDQVPGFGGAFVRADGSVAVYLRDPEHQRGTLEKAAGGGAAVLRGDYEFRELVAWKAALRPLLGMPGVSSLDASEASNRVVVGIDSAATAAQRADVEARIPTLGVPAAAVRYAAMPAMDPMVLITRAPATQLKGKGGTLQSRFLPTFPAGVQINWRIDSQFVGICTLGYIAKRGATTGLVTNRHCTNVEGAVDGTHYRQGGFSDPFVATEISDPAFFTGGDCPQGRRCRFSDAIFAKVDGKAGKPLTEIKKIAKPSKSSPTHGTLSVNTGSRYTIIGRDTAPLEGEIARKVGRTTGETFGPVFATCADVNVTGEDVTNLCQDAVVAGTDHGDSGSPVFIAQSAKRSSSTSGPPVKAIGLMWGGGQLDTGEFVFVYSPLPAVERELGSLGVN